MKPVRAEGRSRPHGRTERIAPARRRLVFGGNLNGRALQTFRLRPWFPKKYASPRRDGARNRGLRLSDNPVDLVQIATKTLYFSTRYEFLGKPENRKTGKPENRKTGKPENRKTGKPENRKTGKPENRKTGKPVFLSPGGGLAGAHGRAKIVVTRALRTQCASAAATLCDRKTGKPENRKTGKPENRKTGKPENRKTGKPENRKTGKPENRKTGIPVSGWRPRV